MYSAYCYPLQHSLQAPYTQEQQLQVPAMPHKKPSTQNDTEEIAAFLCALKHRSVTPEPSLAGDSFAPPSHSQQFSHPSPLRQNEHFVDKTPALLMAEHQQQQQQPLVNLDEVHVEDLIGGSNLVLPKDRDLVPDSLFVAMAQMTPCKLSQADRVGCYKSRELGFVGMSCLHCGGQPGFGRYYPNSVRSLAQTTTSQTILKHVGSKCRFVPPHIRNVVNELQRQQLAREGGLSSGRPRYGSRKVFFQRVWARLHDEPLPEEDNDDDDEEHSQQVSSSPMSSRNNSRDSSPATSDDEDCSSPRKQSMVNKRKTGLLPTQKNLKRSLEPEEENHNKRPRSLSN